jgi:hypothetical protein
MVVDLIRKHFPQYDSALPSDSVEAADFPTGVTFNIDNIYSVEVLGIKYRNLEDTVVVQSIYSGSHGHKAC